MWGRSERLTNRKVDRIIAVAAHELVYESEAFLLGIWASERSDLGLPVPGWAWLNALAHAPARVIRDWADERPTMAPPASTGWREALSLLAGDLLAEADRRGCRVETVQRALLVPLELDCSRPDALPLRDPDSLVGAVHRTLGFGDDPPA